MERTISKKLKDFWLMFVIQNNTSVIYIYVVFKFLYIYNYKYSIFVQFQIVKISIFREFNFVFEISYSTSI